MTARGSGLSLPFSKTLTRPGRSVKNIRPSGAKTIDQGTSRLEMTVSTRKPFDASAAAACPPPSSDSGAAPPPAGAPAPPAPGCPHAARSRKAHASARNGRRNINVRSPLILEVVGAAAVPRSVRDVLVKQLKLRALLAYLDAHDVAHREHAYELAAVHHGQVAAADLLHPFERLA